jgi:hypothetical protein
MRKLIPFIILALFLGVGLSSFGLFLTTPGYYGGVDGDNWSILPAAGPSEAFGEGVANLKPISVDDRGSRFAITTNTILTLDSPEFNASIEYGDSVTITGHLYEDYDNNGTYDQAVDIPIPDAKIHVFFAGEDDNPNHYSIRVTDENGMFQWTKENYEQDVVGLTEIKAIYKGQYTINGSAWFDVTQEIKKNEDNDYYIDTGFYWNFTNSRWQYTLPGKSYSYSFLPNGVFNTGPVDIPTGQRVWGDIIIEDNGILPGTWDSNDAILYDPIRWNSTWTLSSDYTPPGTPGRLDFTGALMDEEKPDVSLSGRWADDDGDWNISLDDVGTDGQPGTNDADGTEGNGWPDPGEPHVDEDMNFTYYRKASSTYINVSLWNPTEIDAVVRNASGLVTDHATVGDTIEILGKLKNTVFSGKRIGGRAIKFRIFGVWINNPVRTDNSGDFNLTYTIPTHHSMKVGKRDINIFYDEQKYDPNYDESLTMYPSYLSKTSLADQNEIITLRINRPTHIIFEYEVVDKPLVGYLYKSIHINGTVVDDNNNPLATTISHDDGTSEIILLDAYQLKFEWGLEVNRYYDYLERDLLDASGNFSIFNYEIKDPFQELGPIPVKITITTNQSQTYYHGTVKKTFASVRGNTIMDLWIDQDRDTYYNEHEGNKHGLLADYITRAPFEDKNGKIWNFNNVVVYGRLAIAERQDNGINGKTIQYQWEGDTQWFLTTSQPIDIDLNGKFDAMENGMFIIPDPTKIVPPKIIERSDDLGPMKITVKYDDPTGYYDKIEVNRNFDVVAMTEIVIIPGGGIKGENLTIRGRLKDDLNNGVPGQNIKLYWEDLKGELLEDDKFDPVKLADSYIGNSTTDENGFFDFYSEEILTRDRNVGQGYVVAIFEGSVMPYTENDAFIGSSSDEIAFNVSAYTKVKTRLDLTKVIRGKHFTIEGQILEKYNNEENPDSKVLLTIADVGQMEIYTKNIGTSLGEIKISNLEVEFKSEGGFTVTGIMPFELDVGKAQLRLVFNGTKNGRYLPSEVRIFPEVWTETYIKILAPETVEKDDGSGYFLKHDLKQEEYNLESDDFIEPIVFILQLLEENPVEGAPPKPVHNGKVLFNISGKYSVFTNFSMKYTDSSGFANFTFNRPLTDTDWDYQLPSTASVELEIKAEFTGFVKDVGKSYYEDTETLPIDTTHHPPPEPPTKDWYEEYGVLLWAILIIVIIFLAAFGVALKWYTKQQRIKGMRRIIKRAADQLIAGNEYTAVIFKSYQKLGVHLRKYGYLRRESETFREFENAVRSALPIDRISMDQFLQLLEEARYSTHQIGENQRNDAIRNLRSIERSLDRIIIDEGAALRALERLETEGVKDTEILVAPKGGGPASVPQLLKKSGPGKTKELPKGAAPKGP